jgi:putative membrane protein (TIGR04086 family)
MGDKTSSKKNYWHWWIKASVFAYIITAVIFIVSALLLTYTDVQENTIKIMSFFSAFISSLVCGGIIASGMEKRGILWGALGGALYVIILMALFYISGKNTSFTSGNIVSIIISLLGGALGGIFGINAKK